MKDKITNVISNIVAVLWCISIVFPVVLCLCFIPLGLFLDIDTIRSSGFSTTNIGFSMFGAFGLLISITMMVPWFRKCFKKLPWLYAYIIISMVNILTITLGIAIVNYGYEVQSEARHTLFFVLMLVQMIICRLAMCVYVKFKPLKYNKE